MDENVLKMSSLHMLLLGLEQDTKQDPQDFHSRCASTEAMGENICHIGEDSFQAHFTKELVGAPFFHKRVTT